MAESLKKTRKLITFSDVKLRIKETLDTRKAVNADEAYEAIAADIVNHFLPSNFLDTSSDLFKKVENKLHSEQLYGHFQPSLEKILPHHNMSAVPSGPQYIMTGCFSKKGDFLKFFFLVLK